MWKKAFQVVLGIMCMTILFSGFRNSIIVTAYGEQAGIGTVVIPASSTFKVVYNGATFHTIITSTSAVSSFTFNQSMKMISFNVTGFDSIAGYCNVTIPKELLDGIYEVLLDGASITYTMTQNSTSSFIYFEDIQNTHKVQIIGTTVISEYPTMIGTIILLTILTLIMVLMKKKIGHS